MKGTFKPLDLLYMLTPEDIESMGMSDLNRLCMAITLDEQLTLEEIIRNESFSNRRNMC